MASVDAALDGMQLDIEKNVIGITSRKDLIFATDLVYHSVLAFPFQGRMLEKGIVEMLCIGDSRIGKTATVKGMLRHYGLGDFILGESATVAGLLGGIGESAKNKRFVSIGRLPLCHRTLVVIDEANELPPEIIGKLSGVRSDGMYDIIKIIQQKIPCRVRLIWLANPRSDKAVAEYPFGVEVIAEVIGKREDIARFDIAIVLSKKDVDREALYEHSADSQPCPRIVTPEFARHRIMFAWSRKPGQVVISKDTEASILKHARLMSEKYSDAIPIVIETEQRNKLARMAVSCANIVCSRDAHGESVVVTPEHVESVHWRLCRIFDSPSMAYDRWSDARTSEIDERVLLVLKALGRNNLHTLLQTDRFGKRLMIDMMGGRQEAGEKAWHMLVRFKALRKIRGSTGALSGELFDLIRVLVTDATIADMPNPGLIAGSAYSGDDEDEETGEEWS